MPDSPHRPLAGQTALVTGASSGLGAASALALAQAGANVAVNYIGSAVAAEEVAKQCTAHGVSAFAVKADVSDEAEVRAMTEKTAQTLGGLDILFANAGVQIDGALTELSLEAWNKVIAVNLTGVFLCMQSAVRAFRTQGMRQSSALGKIIVMSSVHDTIPWAGHVNYAASKGGASMLMKSVAQELAAERIRVNAISPGAIKTAINEDVWSDPKKAEALNTLIPYGRIGKPSDVAQAVVWLASDMADYVTGHTLVVDGGMELFPGFIGNG